MRRKCQALKVKPAAGVMIDVVSTPWLLHWLCENSLMALMQEILIVLMKCPFCQQHPKAFSTALAAALQRLPESLRCADKEKSRVMLQVLPLD